MRLPIRPCAVAVLTCALHLCLPDAGAAQTTSLELKSQPGDFIGGGITQTFGPADGTFTVLRNYDNGVSIFFNGGPHWWYLDFAGPANDPLAPGAYENATRFPMQSPTGPGLSVSGEGRGCNTLTGRFEVLEVSYSANGDVERFAATFEQHCEGGVPALVGSVLYNSTLPPPPPPPTVCVSKVATLDGLFREISILPTSPSTLNGLKDMLLAAQWGENSSRPRYERLALAQFIARAVLASSLRATSPHAISIAAADSLACGASNVLTNIYDPK